MNPLLLVVILCAVIIILFLFQSGNTGDLGRRLKEIENLELHDEGRDRESRRARSGDSDNDAVRQALSRVYVPDRLRQAIQRAGVDLRPEEFALMWISAVMIPSFIAFLLSLNFVAIIALALVGAIIPPFYLSFQTSRRLNLFATQLGDALQLISNGLRAGFSFEQALVSVRTDMTPPISLEFARAVNEMNYGMSLEDALTGITTRMQSNDMKLLTSAVMIQRKTGGNLADILDNLSNTIRERTKLRNRIRVLTAQGRMSGIVVVLLPVFLFAAISWLNPSYMSFFYVEPIGNLLIVVAIALEILAAVVINNMIKLV